jgi:aminoglycoside phosphotransferase family enzyme/predicted kinase
MKLSSLITALSDPTCYAHPVDKVDVRQTHISVVFLAGPYAYKVKKPVDLGFLDYSTLGRRQRFCEQEIRLNRRLAPSVYVGVVPVARDAGVVRMEGPGEVVEWAVKMARLPEEATLHAMLGRDEAGVAHVEELATRLAAFYAQAESGPHVGAAACFDAVARNARENFEQSSAHVGTTVSPAVFERLQALTEESLARHRPLIDTRAASGIPRDGHGDLRLEHVYRFPERQPPDDLVIVDCIEFSDQLRHADPVADIAFIVMDLARRRRRDLGQAFAETYFQAARDEQGWTLLPFYTAYRAAVRAKVHGLKSSEPEVAAEDRAKALAEARAHWLVALGELEEPRRRPGLVLVGGLPGSGKSTLARGLAEHAGFTVIRSDLVRKELAGLTSLESAAVPFGEGIYSTEWTERTYAECARRTERILFEGGRVVVDASFGREANRRAFLDLSDHWGVPATFLLCQAEEAIIRERLESRRRDASDADWSIHEQAALRWDQPGQDTRRTMRVVDTGERREVALSRAVEAVRELGLQD